MDAVCHGADLAAPGVVELDDSITKGATVAMMTLKGEVVGLGIAALPAVDLEGRPMGWSYAPSGS